METKVLKVVCCNCKKVMAKKKLCWDCDFLKEPISHGICDVCGPKLYPTLWKKENK